MKRLFATLALLTGLMLTGGAHAQDKKVETIPAAAPATAAAAPAPVPNKGDVAWK